MARSRYDDRTDFWRDIVIVTFHPMFEDQSMTDALGDLYEYRRQRDTPTYDRHEIRRPDDRRTD
jgi:hypothetical protein